MTVSEHYRGQRGEAYAAVKHADPHHPGERLNYEYFRPYVHGLDSVLDFGCGSGGMALHIKNDVRLVEGLEVNPASASIARSLGITVYGDLHELPPERRYQAVVSNHVFEHVRDVPGTLERLRQHIEPSGLLVLKLPIDDWRVQRDWQVQGVDHHLQTWSPRLLGNTLREAGLHPQSIEVVTSAWNARLFPLLRLRPLAAAAFWAIAVLKKRRQLFAVAQVP